LSTYTPPSWHSDGFNCPHCGAFAHQKWGKSISTYDSSHHTLNDLEFAHCSRCGKYSIWHSSRMIFPSSGNAPLPHSELPWELKQDYEEAKNIALLSPRSAAALLRLIIEKLTDHILQENKGKDLNENIGKLVKLGLPQKIQESLDILRVIGNNALHSGQIDMKDNDSTALALFDLVNLITDVMITKPQKIGSLYNSLPEDAKKGIQRRDKTT